MSFFDNRIFFHTDTTGTSDIVASSAVIGYADPTTMNVANGAVVNYSIVDGVNFAFGLGTWDSSTSTLSRDVNEQRVLSSTLTTNKLSLSGQAKVAFTPTAIVWDAATNFNVKMFGAVGDGVTDDTAAIRSAARALKARSSLFSGYRMGTGSLYFPEGVYRITESGLLSDLAVGAFYRSGMRLVGAGKDNTILWLDPSELAAEAWFYNNGSTKTMWGLVCEHMTFSGGTTWQKTNPSTDSANEYTNINSKCNGFKPSGPGWESAFHFHDCGFRYLQTVFQPSGSNNSDTHIFNVCEVFRCIDVVVQDNQQAFNVTFVAPYINGYFGDLFRITANGDGGGGNFLVQGGAVIASGFTGQNTAQYVVRATAGGTAAANAPVTFDNVRFELRGNYHGFANISQGVTTVLARGCSFHNTGTADKNFVTVSGYTTVLFDACSVSHGTGGGRYKYVIGASGNGTRGKNGAIFFRNVCQLAGSTLATDVTFTNTGGRFSVDESCIDNTTNVAPSSDPKIISIAADVFGPTSSTGGGLGVSTTHRTRLRKTISPFNSASQLTGSAGVTGIACQVPLYSRLVEAWVLIEAGQGNGNNIRCLIGNDDKSVVYGSTTVGAQNAGHYLKVDLGQILADTTNVRRVRFWFDDGAGGNSSASTSGRVDGGVVYE